MLCLHDLVTLTGGTLRLARMPPRDGVWQTVSTIAVHAERVEPGDIYWCLANSGCDVQLAFFRGAAGVIGSKQTEPWPGRFSLCLPDPAVALARVLAIAPELAGTLGSRRVRANPQIVLVNGDHRL